MTNIPSNFSKSDVNYDCLCGSEEDMKHIYHYRILNNGEQQMLEYEKIYNGKVSEQKEIMNIFERNMKKREILRMIHYGLSVEPTSC